MYDRVNTLNYIHKTIADNVRDYPFIVCTKCKALSMIEKKRMNNIERAIHIKLSWLQIACMS